MGKRCLGKYSTKKNMDIEEHRSAATDGTDAGIWRKHERHI